jgi:RNA polymerase sigma factor (sigma-70 family)
VTDKTLKGLFLAHRRELQAYLTEKLKDADTAADLTQEAFLRYAEQNPARTAVVLNGRSYLYRTAHNLAVDYVRQKARQKTDAAAHDDMASVPDDRPSQEDEADARQKLDRLRSIVAELPERTRQIFVLNRVEGLSYAETAERLGISESSVQKHLAKALLHVTKRLRPQ